MRRKDRISNDSESLLRDAPVCRLGFSAVARSAAGGPGEEGTGPYPYVVPVHFVWNGKHVYVHCAWEGEKLRRLARDSHLCVEIDEFGGIIPGERPCSFSTRFRSLIAFGRGSLVHDPAEKRRALAALTAKYAGAEMADWNYETEELESVAVLRIRPESVSVKTSGR